MNIALFGKKYSSSFLSGLTELLKALAENKATVFIHREFYEQLPSEISGIVAAKLFDAKEDIEGKVDFIFSIGGDGTLLQSALLAGSSGIPVLGINTGRLGFLSGVSQENIRDAVQHIFEKKYSIEERTLLSFMNGSDYFGENNFALNELTVSKKDTSSMITIHTWVDDEFVNSYWADGLIVATSTGSTGYSLSCGGPILSPGCGNLVITPIAPHGLTVRPFVISNKSIIKLKVESRSDSFLATLDSRSVTLPSSFELQISRAVFTLGLVRLPGDNFITTLRNKMMWGADKRN
jgi:NAD+ kinase